MFTLTGRFFMKFDHLVYSMLLAFIQIGLGGCQFGGTDDLSPVLDREFIIFDEAEIKFGVSTVGELGNMAIGKVGAGVNYEITLKWKKPEAKNE